MTKEDINSLVSLRTDLIKSFERLRDYKNNKNAIMKEIDHAKILHEAINRLDIVLRNHVEFK